jgi:hypothetical protein
MNIFIKSLFLLMTSIQNLIKIVQNVKQNFKFAIHELQHKITSFLTPQKNVDERISEFDN